MSGKEKKVPSTHEVEKLVLVIEQAARHAIPFASPTSSREKKHAPRPRPGGDAIARTVADLAEKYGLGAAFIETARHGVDAAERLAPVSKALGAFQQAVDDTIFEHRSESWRAMLTLYAVLGGLAQADPALEKALEPVVAFFSVGHRNNKAPKSQKPAA